MDNQALLPSGFHDVLPPQARQEAQLIASLTACYESFGYALVRPPLAEFEESLLSGRSASLAPQTFRVMDPESGRMMGFRADMTWQVARIARTRLANAPRPLRLSYAGAILHVKPGPLRSERQLYQAGFELIGAQGWESDAEAMLIAAESLLRLGLSGISIDINLPTLVAYFIEKANGDEAVENAIRRKDASALPEGYTHRSAVASLLQSAGPAQKALEILAGKTMPELVHKEAARLAPLIAQLGKWLPTLSLTLDALEHRSFVGHQGVSFSLFAEGLRHEVGRGGRYALSDGDATEACGFTLDVTHLLGLLPEPAVQKTKTVPVSTSLDEMRKLQKEGVVAVLS